MKLKIFYNIISDINKFHQQDDNIQIIDIYKNIANRQILTGPTTNTIVLINNEELKLVNYEQGGIYGI
jgi:hypothetical protein